MKMLTYEEYQDKLKKLKTSKDVSNFAKELIAPVLQEMLESEMTEHLGYDKHSLKGKNSGNNRNGHSKKILKTSFGQSQIAVPRDRNGDFEPEAVRKYETVDSDVEEKIISMYAKGMTTRDINEHMGDIYGISVSSGMVSTITDKVLPLVTEWQSRPLESVYPIVYLDGVHFKVRESGKIVSKCGYTVLGITQEGYKELLGIWIGQAEGAKFWLGVLTELKNRGVEDILIACIDGLKGFSDAIATVFPETAVQRCIIHQVRNTMKYVPHKHKKQFCADLRSIYTASTQEAGIEALHQVKEEWPDYSLYLRSWEENWPELSTFFQFPQAIKKIIYTTNSVESVHRQFRKVTKTTSIFPHDEALKKLLWLAQRDISKKWNMALRDWGTAITQFAILFPDRITL
jgi:putative transposase